MKISVIMPVYNGEKYLREAIESILNQTFKDFEFIIINDCSTDSTEEIIKSYIDKRIIYIKNEKNLGVAATLNHGLDIAKGEYIARMDSDDISLPQRFEKQLKYMEKHKDIGVCGGEVELIGDVTNSNTYTVFGKENIKINLLFSSCLCHPTLMLRRNILEETNSRYDVHFDKVEDYELWTRLIMKCNIDNIHGIIFKYRIHNAQVTQNYTDFHTERFIEVKRNQFMRLGIRTTEEEFNTFCRFCFNKLDCNKELLLLVSVFESIYKSNQNTGYFDKNKLKKYLRNILVNLFQKQNKFTIKDLEKHSNLISEIDILKCNFKYKVKRIIG